MSVDAFAADWRDGVLTASLSGLVRPSIFDAGGLVGGELSRFLSTGRPGLTQTSLVMPSMSTASAPSEPWLPEARRRVWELRQLRRGWDEYGAAAPNALAEYRARELLVALAEERLQPTRIAPSPDEGVSFSFMRPGRTAAIECFNDGEIVAAVSAPASDDFRVWRVAASTDDMHSTVGALRAFLGDP